MVTAGQADGGWALANLDGMIALGSRAAQSRSGEGASEMEKQAGMEAAKVSLELTSRHFCFRSDQRHWPSALAMLAAAGRSTSRREAGL